MEVLEERTIPDELVDRRTIELLESFGLSVWVYRGADWLVRDPDGPHVAREAHTVQFEPTVVESVRRADGRREDRRSERRLRHGRGCGESRRATSSATTSPPRARSRTTSTSRIRRRTRAASSRILAERYDSRRDEIATIGDMPNDVLMFAHSGLSIAMGNADRRRAARGAARDDDRTTRTASRTPSSGSSCEEGG